MKSRLGLWFIFLLIIISIFIDIKFLLKLGLDLQGGTELILQTQMDQINPENRDEALDSAREVIEKRVNLYGVSEAVVQSSKIRDERRILVELRGLKDASAAAQLVGKTAQLEFRELPAIFSQEQLEATKSGIPLIAYAQSTGLTGADLKKAAVTFGGSGTNSGPQVAIEFNEAGAKKFAEITKRNIGKPLAIFLDGQVVQAPTVQQEILGGNAVITGQYTTQEAKNLSIQLNAGALPVPIKILEQRHIGPTLGQESIDKSLIAGIIGLSIVALYMAFYYGIWGIIADVALIFYALLVLAIFKTGGFIIPPITLTLAGIAGFILSIGMAVDANILIFERMKEEIRWGRHKQLALELGFKRAWTSIWASNVSSLITAIILYSLGTSIVKGFAITLAIGVLVSMFTATVVTRTFLKFIVK
ncbi:protein-export membrane protein SecD [Candidatus Daviesbacteria bacterium RIFCSPHIGHO2_02_FULL_36_13]|uniref:Protein translocase subunit SecD n=1 Tax=Candidatus Daviesbacteria bacterium RIFCSPHIGHO2_02_FULL_36_13 TaxID=1797768 RepID=A0A1F5JZC5_9BACT|nr:MAG: protein-export membrane protein SecD [Candidatus Daviesbacteria bacterium RIFCSPHIGHO2_02_FULL_36_13]